MSSLRNFVVIVLLAGVLGVVYFAINKAPKPGDNADLAPPWATIQGDLSKAATPTMPPSAAGAQGAAALPGFPAGSALPGTSISSTFPPSVTLPAAPAVAAMGSPPTASPYPSVAPPVRTTPVPPGQPATPPATANQPSPSAMPAAAPSAPRAPGEAIGGQGAPTTPPAASASPPPSGTVVLGQPAPSPQTVFPAGSPAASAPAPVSGPVGPGSTTPPTTSLPAGPNGPTAGPAAQQPAAPQAAAPPGLSMQFVTVMRAAKTRLDAGQFSQAHLELSAYYGSGRLAPDESRLLAELLDQLGGTVVYSREHLLEPAYRAQSGDTLERIAAAYSVTPELLAKINAIRSPRDLVSGQELKVVRGPFDAVVDLSRYEMTVLVGGRYAGRFRIGIGRDRANLEGAFVVRDKKTRPIYYGPDRVIASDDPANPLGGRLLNLGTVTEPWGIHGTDNGKNVGSNEGRGTICLSPPDIDDVYDILSIGSRVTVRR